MGLVASVVATLAAVAGIGALLVPPVIDQTQALITGLPQTLTNIQNVVAQWASQYPVLRGTQLGDVVTALIDAATNFLRESMLPYVKAGGKLFIECASVIVMALYLAVRPRLYRDGILSLVAPKHRAVGVRVLDDASATLRAWVVGQLLAMLVLGVLTVASVLIMGTLIGVVGLVVAVPVLAVTMVFVRHVVQVEIYGDTGHAEPAVLRSTAEFRIPKTPTAA